jgi:transcriptional regulator with XRE-family HTH domain
LTSQPTTQAAPQTRPLTPTSYTGFGIALKNWLLCADRSQKELAHFLQVNPSTVTNWVQGQKRPDVQSLVKLLAHFKGPWRTPNSQTPPHCTD